MALAFVRVSQAQTQYTLKNTHIRFMPTHTHACRSITVHPHIHAPSGKGWLLCDTLQVAESTRFVEGKKRFLE